MRDYDALMTYIAEKSGTAFAWKACDCITFANASTVAMTGHDHVADTGLDWSDARTAISVISEFGGLREAVSAFLPEIDPAMAMRGDWMLVPGRKGDLVAVCEGDTAVAPSDRGLVRFPRAAAIAAWSVE